MIPQATIAKQLVIAAQTMAQRIVLHFSLYFSTLSRDDSGSVTVDSGEGGSFLVTAASDGRERIGREVSLAFGFGILRHCHGVPSWGYPRIAIGARHRNWSRRGAAILARFKMLARQHFSQVNAANNEVLASEMHLCGSDANPDDTDA